MSIDKIKLAYAWIGPRGPIWNTELPNVLNFAHVSEGIDTIQSQKVFGDDISVILRSESFEIYPMWSLDYDDERHFVVPYTLTWRIQFERYFYGREGIIEFSHLPAKILGLIKRKNGYILINHSIEAFMTYRDLDALHGYFGTTHNIPLHKIIYLTGCINSQESYDQYCIDRGIPDIKGRRLSIVTHTNAITSFIDNTSKYPEPDYNTDIVPNKLFLMWNRRLRAHRTEISMHLEKENLINRSFISFDSNNPDMPGTSSKDTIDYVRLSQVFSIEQDVCDRFCDRLPLILDDERDVNQMCWDYGNKTRTYYQNSLISIVTETHFYEHAISLTEKSLKPVKEKHPFIVAGVSGVLKGIKQFGFKTFNDFWDESYDDIMDSTQRMQLIMKIISDIASWDQQKILEFRRNVKPILDYNYNLVKTLGNSTTVNSVADIVNGNK